MDSILTLAKLLCDQTLRGAPGNRDETVELLDAALSAPQQSEGEWQRVPKEPDVSMIEAGKGATYENFGEWNDPVEIYRAMLAAAPASPVVDEKHD